MNTKEFYRTVAELVVDAWHDDASGKEKLEGVIRQTQDFVEAHDTKVLSLLPIPTFAKVVLEQLIDNPATDRLEAFVVATSVQKVYEAVVVVSDMAGNLFDNVNENIQVIIDVVLARLGVK